MTSHLDNKRSYDSSLWTHPPHWVRPKTDTSACSKNNKNSLCHPAHLMCSVPCYKIFIHYYIFITILKGKCYWFALRGKNSKAWRDYITCSKSHSQKKCGAAWPWNWNHFLIQKNFMTIILNSSSQYYFLIKNVADFGQWIFNAVSVDQEDIQGAKKERYY